jgi:hypothetical protein
VRGSPAALVGVNVLAAPARKNRAAMPFMTAHLP